MVANFGFIGSPSFGKRTDSSNIVSNIVYWLDISFLQNGQFCNIGLHELDYLGNDLSKLMPITGTGWVDGQVYQSKFKNWIYESGLTLDAGITAPKICSGIWIGGDFYTKTAATGALTYHIDYRNGRIIFDTAYGPDYVYGSGEGSVPIYSEFSYKNIYILSDEDATQNAVMAQFTTMSAGSGIEYLKTLEIPLPVISIYERRKEWRPRQIGGSKIALPTVICHIYSSNTTDRNALCDILAQQENKKVPSIDWSTCETPLNEYGDINPLFSGIYDIRTTYPWKDIYITKSTSEKTNIEIPEGIINYSIEVESYM